jgi:hypothetical protein
MTTENAFERPRATNYFKTQHGEIFLFNDGSIADTKFAWEQANAASLALTRNAIAVWRVTKTTGPWNDAKPIMLVGEGRSYEGGLS